MAFLLHSYWFHIIFFFFFLVLLTKYTGYAHNLRNEAVSNNSSLLAAFVFGDSTVDPGNNNYINTFFRSDFLPYGVDYPGHSPTGRFCNGMLATDFIASYAGIKQYIPPYLDPKLGFNDLITGVSFASAGSGYDPLTAAKNSVIEMKKQLEYFDEYRIRMKSMIGKRRMKDLIKRSIFVISCGTNDILFSFGIVDSPVQPFTAPLYLRFLLEQSKLFIQGLMDRGAKTIGVVGVPPVGCLPAVITIHPPNKPRQCVKSLSALASDFNRMLQNEFKAIEISQPTITLIYADIYSPLEDQINHPNKYGFEEVNKGCCGTGLLESSFTCNSLINICTNRSKYVFWDSIHPTETSYNFLFQALRPFLDSILRKL